MTKARTLADFNTTAIPASVLTGALPAINGSALTNLPAGATNTPAFRAYRSTNQPDCPSGQLTKVLLDATDYDTNSAFSNNVFTVPTGEAGKYFLYGSIQTTSSDDFDDYQVKITKNGSTGLARGRIRHHYTDTSQVTTVAELAVGDTIELSFYNGHGSAKQLFGDSQGTFLGGFKLA